MSKIKNLPSDSSLSNYFSSIDLSPDQVEQRVRMFVELIPMIDMFYERKPIYKDADLLRSSQALLKELAEKSEEVEVEFE